MISPGFSFGARLTVVSFETPAAIPLSRIRFGLRIAVSVMFSDLP